MIEEELLVYYLFWERILSALIIVYYNGRSEYQYQCNMYNNKLFNIFIHKNTGNADVEL